MYLCYFFLCYDLNMFLIFMVSIDCLQELSKSKNGKRIWGTKDDSDVLIECRDVYKSFGEKHILRGVSFKVIFIYYVL